MSRNEYEHMKSVLTFHREDEDGDTDKLKKIDVFLDLFRHQCETMYRRMVSQTLEEMMTNFTGSTGMKYMNKYTTILHHRSKTNTETHTLRLCEDVKDK